LPSVHDRSCTATDAAGNQATCTFTVHVNGAGEQINNLNVQVQSLGLQSGTANSLNRETPGGRERVGQRRHQGGLRHPRRFPQRSECAGGQEAHGCASQLADRRSHAHPRRARLPLTQNFKTKIKTMKTKNLFLVPALIAALNLIPAGRVTAQTFTTLHSFSALPRPFVEPTATELFRLPD